MMALIKLLDVYYDMLLIFFWVEIYIVSSLF